MTTTKSFSLAEYIVESYSIDAVDAFQEKTISCEPIQEKSVYICSTRRIQLRNKESEKQSITGYEIMSSIRPSFTRSAMTERFNGYEGCIASQDANTLPLHPHRR